MPLSTATQRFLLDREIERNTNRSQISPRNMDDTLEISMSDFRKLPKAKRSTELPNLPSHKYNISGKPLKSSQNSAQNPAQNLNSSQNAVQNSLDVAEWTRKATEAEVAKQTLENDYSRIQVKNEELRSQLETTMKKLSASEKLASGETEKRQLEQTQNVNLRKELNKSSSDLKKSISDCQQLKDSGVFAVESRKLREALEQMDKEHEKERKLLIEEKRRAEFELASVKRELSEGGPKVAQKLRKLESEKKSMEMEARVIEIEKNTSLQRNTDLEIRIDDLEQELKTAEETISKTMVLGSLKTAEEIRALKKAQDNEVERLKCRNNALVDQVDELYKIKMRDPVEKAKVLKLEKEVALYREKWKHTRKRLNNSHDLIKYDQKKLLDLEFEKRSEEVKRERAERENFWLDSHNRELGTYLHIEGVMRQHAERQAVNSIKTHAAAPKLEIISLANRERSDYERTIQKFNAIEQDLSRYETKIERFNKKLDKESRLQKRVKKLESKRTMSAETRRKILDEFWMKFRKEDQTEFYTFLSPELSNLKDFNDTQHELRKLTKPSKWWDRI